MNEKEYIHLTALTHLRIAERLLRDTQVPTAAQQEKLTGAIIAVDELRSELESTRLVK